LSFVGLKFWCKQWLFIQGCISASQLFGRLWFYLVDPNCFSKAQFYLETSYVNITAWDSGGEELAKGW
jgi:hypothetical protein